MSDGRSHIYNSWGRTRSPKSLTGENGKAVTLNVAADLLGITATTAGYLTENQRYLHVLTEDNDGGTPGTISVFGYCHAFQRWFELPQSHVPVGTNAAPTAAAIVAPTDSGHSDAALLTPDEREYRVYEIVGIDRVAFIGSGANVDCYAACSTF